MASDVDNVDALHMLGVIELQAGDHAEAVELLEEANQLAPGRADIWNHLGAAYATVGRIDDALAAFQRSLKIDADLPDTHFNLGVAYQKLSRHSEAVACLRRAIELRPTFAEAHFKLGTLLQFQGDPNGAVESLRRAIDLRPDYPQARRRLAKCLEQLGENVNGSADNSAAMDEVLRQFGENEAPADEIDDRLFFVFGTPKSGTTWLQMLLDAHPQVRCRPEDQFSFFLHQMPRVVAAYNKTLAEVDRRTANQQADLLDSSDSAFLCAALIRRVLAKGFADPAVQRSGAKDNAIVRMLPAFSRLFRTSRFVYVVRVPVCPNGALLIQPRAEQSEALGSRNQPGPQAPRGRNRCFTPMGYCAPLGL